MTYELFSMKKKKYIKVIKNVAPISQATKSK